MTEERNLRKTRVGKVVSTKMDKTIVVAIEDNVGDKVSVMETRPLSATKRWRLESIIEKAK